MKKSISENLRVEKRKEKKQENLHRKNTTFYIKRENIAYVLAVIEWQRGVAGKCVMRARTRRGTSDRMDYGM